MSRPFIISFFGESHIETLELMAELQDKIQKYLDFVLEGEENVLLLMTNYDDNVFDMVAFCAAEWLRLTEEKTNFSICLVAEKAFAKRRDVTAQWHKFDRQFILKEGNTNDYITRARVMADVADRIVCYVNDSTDKVIEVFDYAAAQNKKIINFGNRKV